MLRRALRLPPQERRLALVALGWLATVRLLLWLIPFERLRQELRRASDRSSLSMHPDRPSASGIARAVVRASRFVPRATCLAQAMTAQLLLSRAGYPATLHIGVARGADGRFEAHAWTMCEGTAIIGGAELERYARLSLPEESLS